MQRLWQKSLGWEDTIHWQAFRNESQVLATIELAWHPLPQAHPAAIQLHIFSDESEFAYGSKKK